MVEYSENPGPISREETLRRLQQARIPREKKKPKPIAKVSKKKAKQIAEEKKAGTDGAMDLFFAEMRKKMVGVCQCGCARKSSKMEDDNFRSSICHIFPKRIFKSIATHPLNWVERNFWEGCHGNMDNRSIELWKNFADWDDIKERFHALAPLLTEEERANKFYTNLENLVYGK